MTVKALAMQSAKTLWSILRVLRLSNKTVAALPKTNITEVILLGNGPSFKETFKEHDEYLKSHDTFAVNHFCKHKEYKELKPKNYIILDSKIFLKDVESSYKVVKQELFDALVSNTQWDMNLFIPTSTDIENEFEELSRRNPHIHVYYFNLTTLEGMNSIIYPLYDKNMGMPFAGNVMVAAIMLSIHMGYKKIKLVGADHSFHLVTTVNKDNHFCAQESHFYEEKVVDIPMYSDVKKEHMLLTHEYFKHVSMQFEAYHLVEAYAGHKNVNVINASGLSFIDAFRREKLEG